MWGTARPIRDFTRALCDFNPRARVGTTCVQFQTSKSRDHFNPRAPCGARRAIRLSWTRCFRNFNPRAPCGVRLCCHEISVVMNAFQSTCPAWGTTYRPRLYRQTIPISIHVPRVGHDVGTGLFLYAFTIISIHVPVWGTTGRADPSRPPSAYFNPRARCGARPQQLEVLAPLRIFQSTCPLWGTTRQQVGAEGHKQISTRVPRGARLRQRRSSSCPAHDFNPRAPCGARRHCPRSKYDQRYFNPCAPCGARRWRITIANMELIFQSTCPV